MFWREYGGVASGFWWPWVQAGQRSNAYQHLPAQRFPFIMKAEVLLGSLTTTSPTATGTQTIVEAMGGMGGGCERSRELIGFGPRASCTSGALN